MTTLRECLALALLTPPLVWVLIALAEKWI